MNIGSKQELFSIRALGRTQESTDTVVGFVSYCLDNALGPKECSFIKIGNPNEDPNQSDPKCPDHPDAGMWFEVILEVGGDLRRYTHSRK